MKICFFLTIFGTEDFDRKETQPWLLRKKLLSAKQLKKLLLVERNDNCLHDVI